MIDRIQIGICDIYNVHVYAMHKNFLEFAPVKNFVSVGIGPLCYSKDYVMKDEPDPTLKGDLQLMALKMGVRLPPLEVGTKEEFKIFTAYMVNHPKPSGKHFWELAKNFFAKSDGNKIFPQLPSMLKAYYKKWKKNQQIRSAEVSYGDPVHHLLAKLSGVKTTYSDTYEVSHNSVDGYSEDHGGDYNETGDSLTDKTVNECQVSIN